MTIDYTRTLYATDSAAAQFGVKHMAKRDGYRVRTVKAIRLAASPSDDAMPRYTVTLAVEPVPALEVACD